MSFAPRESTASWRGREGRGEGGGALGVNGVGGGGGGRGSCLVREVSVRVAVEHSMKGLKPGLVVSKLPAVFRFFLFVFFWGGGGSFVCLFVFWCFCAFFFFKLCLL